MSTWVVLAKKAFEVTWVSHNIFRRRREETLQDVAENEIESNWDQVVDKSVASCRLFCLAATDDMNTALITWIWNRNCSEVFTPTGEYIR